MKIDPIGYVMECADYTMSIIRATPGEYAPHAVALYTESQLRQANAGEWADDDFSAYAKEIEAAVLEKLKAQELTNESAYQRGYIDGKGSDTKRITELEAQNATLSDALKLALRCHGQMLLSDPPQEAWKYHRVDEVARAALATQEVKP